jgi:hypothetical protein
MKPQMLLASRATPFIALMYAIMIDKLQGKGGKPDEETTLEITSLAKEVLPVWGKAIPDLRDVCLSVLRGKGKEEAWSMLGQILKKLVPEGKSDEQIPSADLELLKALGAYFRTDSEIAKTKLIKFASMTKNPWIVQTLAPKTGNQQNTKAALEKLMQKLVGRKDTALTLEEAPKVKAVNPEGYRQYLSLRKEFNQAWRDALVSFIRKSGKEKVPYKDAVDYLKLNGIDHLMPEGFTGLIDDLGRLYTQKGIAIEGVPNAVTFPRVTMNPTYGKKEGGDWVFMARREDGGPGPYFYTTDFKKGQARLKFKKVADLSTKIEAMRKKWFSRVKVFDITKPECVAATVLEILYEFAARIGSLGNVAHGQSTYGVATLLVKHAIIDPAGNITLRYKGKDGVATVHKLVKGDPYQKFVIEALHKLLSDKDSKERIFTYEKAGKRIPLSPAQVNQFFKACGAPEGTTVHKIRTVTGTKIFTEMMNQVLEKKLPKTEKEATALFTKLAEAVGKKLNHIRTTASGGTKVTGATALAAYVDVSVQLLYWSTVGFRIPKYLEKYSESLGNE